MSSRLELHHFFGLAFGMIIGVGWITILGFWLDNAGPVGAVLGFALGALAMLPIALVYAELAGRYPVTGGPIVYTQEAFGSRAAFFAGWTMLFTFLTLAIFEAISFGWLLGVIVPAVRGPVLYELLGTDVRLGDVAAGMVGTLALSVLNLKSAALVGRFQNGLTLLLAAVALILVVSALAFGSVDHFEPKLIRSAQGSIWPGVVAVFVTAPFFFTGFEAVAQGMGEKSENIDGRGIAKVCSLALFGALIFYAAIILAASAIAPRDILLQAELPAAEAFRVGLGSNGLATLVLGTGLLGLLSTWNGAVFVGVRVLSTMSRSGMLPKRLGGGGDGEVTLSGIALIAIISMVGILLGRNAIMPLVNAGSLSIGVVFALVAAALILLRRQPHQYSPEIYTLPGGLTLPILAMLASLLVTTTAFWDVYAPGKGMPLEWTLFGSWTLLGLITLWDTQRRHQH